MIALCIAGEFVYSIDTTSPADTDVRQTEGGGRERNMREIEKERERKRKIRYKRDKRNKIDVSE